jgi:hypothetical protein
LARLKRKTPSRWPRHVAPRCRPGFRLGQFTDQSTVEIRSQFGESVPFVKKPDRNSDGKPSLFEVVSGEHAVYKRIAAGFALPTNRQPIRAGPFCAARNGVRLESLTYGRQRCYQCFAFELASEIRQ